MTRRDLLKRFGTMTAAAIALPHLDLDQLIWTPKPIVVVPSMPTPAMIAVLTSQAERWFVTFTVMSDGVPSMLSCERVPRLPDTTKGGINNAP